VGTRTPGSQAQKQIYSIIESITQRPGVIECIVSGFAEGIDRLAHEAALDFGVPTLAIVACGLDLDYPSGREDLRKEICAGGGLLLSPFPPGTEPQKWHFLARNRWIAEFSAALWVVEAPLPSGALNTAKWARELGRTTYSTPADPWNPSFAGNIALLEQPDTQLLLGPASLGSTWLELSTSRNPSERGVRSRSPLGRVIRYYKRQGTPWTVEDLRAWALKNGWSNSDFERELRRGL
jgi:DNA protecting protein DprA